MTAAKAKTQAKKSKGSQQQIHGKSVIPFRAGDRILLVGEGRFLLAVFAALRLGLTLWSPYKYII
jgi:hypothetical protein